MSKRIQVNENVYTIACYHADGKKMEDGFEFDPQSSLGRELQEALSDIEREQRKRENFGEIDSSTGETA